MSEKNFEFLNAVDEAVLILRGETIEYVNARAEALLGPCAGRNISEVLDGYAAEPDTAAELTIGGRALTVRTVAVGALKQCFLRECPPEADVFPTLAASLRSSIASLNTISAQAREKYEREPGAYNREMAVSLTGLYLKMLKNLRNAEVVAGVRPAVRKLTDVAEHLDYLLSTVMHVCPRTPLTMKLKEGLLARVDGQMFDTMILDLISNGILHGEPGGEISVSMSETPSHVLISVRSRGQGISDDDMTDVFARYASDRLSSLLKPGAGLGLSAVRCIANMHGGTLMLKNGSDGVCATVSLEKAAKIGNGENCVTEFCSMEHVLAGLYGCVEEDFYTARYLD